MRQAADILSSAPAMQIRYLEAMQAMAKSANSKVIFLPGASQNMSTVLNAAASSPQRTGQASGNEAGQLDFAAQDPGYLQALNARVMEDI